MGRKAYIRDGRVLRVSAFCDLALSGMGGLYGRKTFILLRNIRYGTFRTKGLLASGPLIGCVGRTKILLVSKVTIREIRKMIIQMMTYD